MAIYILARAWKIPLNYKSVGRRLASSFSFRFVQFQRKNDERQRLGLVSEDGCSLVELSSATCVSNDFIRFLRQNISMQELDEKAKMMAIEPVNDNMKLLPPVLNPGKIVCIGLNYKCHCEEQNIQPPTNPMFFSKFSSSLIGPTDNIIAHEITRKIDWEVELAVIIGKVARCVPAEDAMNYVFGYTIAQDITARDWQRSRNGGQFQIAKSMDTFCPLGPSIVHKSVVPDPNNLYMKTLVNGVEKQCGNTSEMLFKIDEIICRITRAITLQPGDIILTGTPKGVGAYRKPQEYLLPGDVLESEIACLGKIRNTIICPPS